MYSWDSFMSMRSHAHHMMQYEVTCTSHDAVWGHTHHMMLTCTSHDDAVWGHMHITWWCSIRSHAHHMMMLEDHLYIILWRSMRSHAHYERHTFLITVTLKRSRQVLVIRCHCSLCTSPRLLLAMWLPLLSTGNWHLWWPPCFPSWLVWELSLQRWVSQYGGNQCS